MPLYECTDLSISVRADDMDDAAQMIAKKIAKSRYGRRGCVATVQRDGYSPNGDYATYQAFIGEHDGSGVSGDDVWFVVDGCA